MNMGTSMDIIFKKNINTNKLNLFRTHLITIPTRSLAKDTLVALGNPRGVIGAKAHGDTAILFKTREMC